MCESISEAWFKGIVEPLMLYCDDEGFVIE